MSKSDGGEPPVIRLSVCTTFSPGWLIKRMKTLNCGSAPFDLQLLMSSVRWAQPVGEYDGIITPDDVPAGWFSIPLALEELVAVYSPSIDPSAVPLIRTMKIAGRQFPSWEEYADKIPDSRLALGGREFSVSHFLLAKEMAQEGIGVALIPYMLAEAGLVAGNLALLSTDRLPTGRIYQLCIESSRRQEPAVQAFVNWICQFLDEDYRTAA